MSKQEQNLNLTSYHNISQHNSSSVILWHMSIGALSSFSLEHGVYVVPQPRGAHNGTIGLGPRGEMSQCKPQD